MNRRTFLKTNIQLLALLASLKYQPLADAAAHWTTAKAAAYGSGAYGQGLYPGHHQIYLPIMKKEDK
jgi:hypothetical protein